MQRLYNGRLISAASSTTELVLSVAEGRSRKAYGIATLRAQPLPAGRCANVEKCCLLNCPLMLIGVVILLQDHVPKAGFLWLVFSLRSQILIYNKRKGTANDIYQAGLKDCHVTLLEQFQAKAFATAPILQGDKLWGVIAAYQNASSRQWQSYEVDSLSKIGTQIGVVSC